MFTPRWGLVKSSQRAVVVGNKRNWFNYSELLVNVEDSPRIVRRSLDNNGKLTIVKTTGWISVWIDNFRNTRYECSKVRINGSVNISCCRSLFGRDGNVPRVKTIFKAMPLHSFTLLIVLHQPGCHSPCVLFFAANKILVCNQDDDFMVLWIWWPWTLESRRRGLHA